MNNILGIIVSFIFVFIIIGISTFLSNKGLLSNEGSRKFIHIGVSNWWIIAMTFFSNAIYASIVPLAFVLINYISYKKQIFNAMERDGNREDLGTVYYALSLLILSLLTFKNGQAPYIGALGILIMGYGDGFAAIIGQKFKSKEYRVGNNKKTVYGSLTMFIVSFLVSFLVLNIFNGSNKLLNSLLLSVTATILEAISPLGLDNLTVPLLTSFLYMVIK